MYEMKRSNQFAKDYVKAYKAGKDLDKIDKIMFRLANKESLESKHKEHSLTGNYKGHKECHITPDWLLIYSLDVENNLITFVRTGTHSELF
jgi:mRNA interferase YafQ